MKGDTFDHNDLLKCARQEFMPTPGSDLIECKRLLETIILTGQNAPTIVLVIALLTRAIRATNATERR